jgi:hypothetical protein
MFRDMKISTKYSLIANLLFLSFNIVVFFYVCRDSKDVFCKSNRCYSDYLSRDIESFFKSDRTLAEVIAHYGEPTNSTTQHGKLMLDYLLPPNLTISFPENSIVGFSVVSDSNGVIHSWSYSRVGTFLIPRAESK